jgi:hypothetical protein
VVARRWPLDWSCRAIHAHRDHARKLLATGRDAASAKTRALLDRWGKLHAMGGVLSLLATVLLLWQLCGTS